MHRLIRRTAPSVNVWLPIVGAGTLHDPYRPDAPADVMVHIHTGVATHTPPHPLAGSPIWPFALCTIAIEDVPNMTNIIPPRLVPRECRHAYRHRRKVAIRNDPQPFDPDSPRPFDVMPF